MNDDNGQPAADQAQPAAASPTDSGAPAIMDNPFTGSDSPMAAPTTAPVVSTPSPQTVQATDNPAPTASSPSNDDLLQLKQQALQNLAPVLGQLDQTPEEKFKTTMMLIQASDNSELVKSAYEAANQIPDEKARAQALLDVVNEINYFTHPSNKAQ